MNRLNENCAVFLTADPMTLEELKIVKEAKKLYDNVDIILDRKSTENRYRLSYNDRKDIVMHELKANKLDDITIIPNDNTLLCVLNKNNFKALVLGINIATSKKVLNKIHFINKISNKISVVAIPVRSSITSDLISMLLNNVVDASIQQKYFSDYAFMKSKLNMITKYGVVSEDKKIAEIILKKFAEYDDFDILDLDMIKAKDYSKCISSLIRTSNKKKLILFSEKLFDNGIDKICNSIIAVYSNQLSTVQREYMKKCNMYIDALGNDESIVRNTINFINKRIV